MKDPPEATGLRALNITTKQWVVSETAEAKAEHELVTDSRGNRISGLIGFDALYEDAALAAVDSAASLVAAAFPLIGSVINAGDDEVVIDVGAIRGAKVGDTFIIFRKGEELFHPSSQEHLGWKKTVLAALEVTALEATLSTGKVVAVGDATLRIRPGDRVVSRPSSGG